MRPGRQLAVLGVIFVVLYALVFFAGASGSWKERLEPRLGLDLVGGTRMTLQATNSLDGQPPTPENLEEARRIIDNRVNALGVAEAEVVTEGDRNIVISLPGENRNLSEVGSAAELRFRKVLKVADGSGVSLTQPQPTPEAGGDADAPQASPAPEASASPEASGDAGGQGGAAPSATPSAEPSPSAATGGDATIEQQLGAVREKVGKEAWDAANGLQAPADLSTQPELAEALEPFGTLTGREVAVLPANIQFNVPFISCEQLNDRPAASIKDPAAKWWPVRAPPSTSSTPPRSRGPTSATPRPRSTRPASGWSASTSPATARRSGPS